MPGVAQGIKKKSIFERKIFSLCHSWATLEFIQKMLAHSVQPFGRLQGTKYIDEFLVLLYR